MSISLTSLANLDGYNYPKQLLPQAEYVDDVDLTATSHAWEALSGDPGVVAVSDEFVAAKQLPTAMRYPWDSSKGVYLLQGFHNLHCLVSNKMYSRFSVSNASCSELSIGPSWTTILSDHKE
jgi:hypothetical protein